MTTDPDTIYARLEAENDAFMDSLDALIRSAHKCECPVCGSDRAYVEGVHLDMWSPLSVAIQLFMEGNPCKAGGETGFLEACEVINAVIGFQSAKGTDPDLVRAQAHNLAYRAIIRGVESGQTEIPAPDTLGMICPECNWERDPPEERGEDYGPNGSTVSAYRASWKAEKHRKAFFSTDGYLYPLRGSKWL